MPEDIPEDEPVGDIILDSRRMADAVSRFSPTATAVSIVDHLEAAYDCHCYSRTILLDHMGMLVYFRRTLESAVHRRCEEGLELGLSPKELCQSVCSVFQ